MDISYLILSFIIGGAVGAGLLLIQRHKAKKAFERYEASTETLKKLADEYKHSNKTRKE